MFQIRRIYDDVVPVNRAAIRSVATIFREHFSAAPQDNATARDPLSRRNKGDPTGTWSLVAKDFEANGVMLGQLQLPALVVQAGGYRTRTLGTNARHSFSGLVQGAYGSA